MPKVKVDGKTKHFPYSKRGKAAARRAVRQEGGMKKTKDRKF